MPDVADRWSALLRALLPVETPCYRLALDGRSGPRINDEGALEVTFEWQVWGPKLYGSSGWGPSDIWQQELSLLAPADLTDERRAAAFLRAWVDALRVAFLCSVKLASALPADFYYLGALREPALQTEGDFRRVLLTRDALGWFIPGAAARPEDVDDALRDGPVEPSWLASALDDLLPLDAGRYRLARDPEAALTFDGAGAHAALTLSRYEPERDHDASAPVAVTCARVLLVPASAFAGRRRVTHFLAGWLLALSRLLGEVRASTPTDRHHVPASVYDLSALTPAALAMPALLARDELRETHEFLAAALAPEGLLGLCDRHDTGPDGPLRTGAATADVLARVLASMLPVGGRFDLRLAAGEPAVTEDAAGLWVGLAFVDRRGEVTVERVLLLPRAHCADGPRVRLYLLAWHRALRLAAHRSLIEFLDPSRTTACPTRPSDLVAPEVLDALPVAATFDAFVDAFDDAMRLGRWTLTVPNPAG